MSYIKLPLLPGVFTDDTPLAAEGYSVMANWIRFRAGKPQTIGGYERVTNDVMTGICRGLHAWRGASSLAYAAMGTHTNLYAYNDGEIRDITPDGLAAGLEDGTAGVGYGTGEYGMGDYGESSEVIFYPRTWSMDNWGPNLVACPRGGAIYEWAPNFTATDVVTNGEFAADTDWTKGTGWTIAAGVAAGAAGTGSDLEQEVTLEPHAYYRLQFDYTRSAGTLQPKLDGEDIGSALSAATGSVDAVVYSGFGGAQDLAFTKDAAFDGTVDNVSLTQLTIAYPIPGAPEQNTFILVTPELILMAFGTIDADTGEFNPMQIRCSDTGDGDYSKNQDWTPTGANLSRRWTLAKGGRIVAARNGLGEVLCWTDTALYRGVYVPDGSTVYQWTLVGTECGLIGPNAVAMKNGRAYWMTPAGKFMVYSGGSPEELYSTVGRDVSENLAPAQGDKVYASSLTGFNEIWFWVPDIRDGNECSRYVILQIDQSVWSIGRKAMTAYMDIGALGYPIAVGTNGLLYYMEKGNSADGEPLEWSRLSGVIPIGNGNTLFSVPSFLPNADDWVGGFNLTVRMANEPNGPFTTYGPYAVASNSTRVDLGPMFPTGKFGQFLFEGNSAPAFMREGVHQIDVHDTGMVF